MKKIVLIVLALGLFGFAQFTQAEETPAILANLEGAEVMSDAEMISVDGTGILDSLIALLQSSETPPTGPDFLNAILDGVGTTGPGGGLLVQVIRDRGLTDDTLMSLRDSLLGALGAQNEAAGILIGLLQGGLPGLPAM